LHVLVGMPADAKDVTQLLGLLAQLVSTDPSLVKTACPAGQDAVRLQCRWVEVAEDRSRPGGRTIRLFVMRKEPPSGERRPGSAPIAFLNGGPGRSATADAWWAELALGSLAITHSLVFADQRGTGSSAPLDCDFWPERKTSDRRFPLAAVRRCRDALASTAALDRYGTADAVMDLEAVRRALGIEQLNLYGISYGARVALGYAVLFPGRVRSMVLHSPALFTKTSEVGGDASRRALARALEGQDPRELDAALGELAAAPLDVPFQRWSRIDTARVGPKVGAWLLRDLLYDPDSWDDLRASLRSLRDRRAGPVLAAALGDFARAESGRSVGAFIGVTCTEDIPAIPTPIAVSWTSVLQEEFAEVCREWPRALLPTWWGRTPPSDVPTLFISGRWDPVTPADSAASFARRMGSAQALVIERGGHGGTWECAIRVVERFVETGSSVGLPATCD